MRIRSSQDVFTPMEMSSQKLEREIGKCVHDLHDSVSAMLACRGVDPNFLASFDVSEDLTQEAIQMEEDRALGAKDRLALKSEVLESEKRKKIANLENDIREMAEGFDYVSKTTQAIFAKLASYKDRMGHGENMGQKEYDNAKEGVEICKMAVTLCKELRVRFKKKINRLLAIDGSPKILKNPKVKKAVERLY